VTLGEYLKEKGYGARASHYLIPMEAPFGHSTLDEMMDFH